ncbi:5'-AMP-activated protein kinase beta subunit, interation domain-containing protein [Paraphoma chrysanthemicola]|uniref:5'-AMP-activated protein kinase beta subunit, interation domain-containing protein n=1 Tax=Paraphoma chrysanthemicola TaxID=798071 RepID=A0A8K0R789_9PLEO|nr:5'-AMP-activated protein kinase beta subunit, interation domain-containing protein [Paraphoma chrysanthemicola]
MGNQQSSSSRSTTPTSNPQSPSSVTTATATASHAHKERAAHPHPHIPHFHHTARRRESIPALSTVKSQAAPPSASFENAESHPTSTSTRPHSRGRSVTVAATTSAVIASNLRAAQDSFKSTSSHLHDTTMGNEQSKAGSKDKGHHLSRDITPQHLHQPTTSPPEKAQTPAPEPAPAPAPSPSPQTRPVDVPTAPRDEPAGSRTDDLAVSLDPVSASQQQEYIIPASHFSRPPRLPLPIEEEDHRPGSPIDHDEVDSALPRHPSMLSTTTADDEDLADEFKGPNSGRPTVPTLIEWEGEGERVYVTGTFAGWDRKYRLHRNGPSKKKNALSAYIHITPGTHHLAFLVDNDMRTSDKLPTAVDYTNILVNYIEVSLAPPEPAAAEQTDKQKLDAATPVQDREKPSGIYPPQVIPKTPEIQPIKAPLPEPPAPKVPEPTKKYHQNIPRYLLDLDAPEESSRFARANAMTNNLPTPPTLPGFLGKSILNGTTPHKDDSSVLIMPNHTVLNHLATSSIKDNILATSATTRYKQKFLTTIMYKPKEEDPDRY